MLQMEATAEAAAAAATATSARTTVTPQFSETWFQIPQERPLGFQAAPTEKDTKGFEVVVEGNRDSRFVKHVTAAEDDLALSSKRLPADGARRRLVSPCQGLGFHGSGQGEEHRERARLIAERATTSSALCKGDTGTPEGRPHSSTQSRGIQCAETAAWGGGGVGRAVARRMETPTRWRAHSRQNIRSVVFSPVRTLRVS